MKNSTKTGARAIEYAVIAAFVSGVVFVSTQFVEAKAFGSMNMPAMNAVSDTAPADTTFKAD